MSNQACRVIATIGLHGSASTWAFNVVRELMIASFGEAQVRATYADILAHLREEERTLALPNLVIKSHHGSEEIDAWLTEAGARLVVSVRDPRDAALSMSQRFKTPLRHTVQWLLTDCARMVRVVETRPILLRYEERPFDDPESVHRLGEALGLSPAAAAAEAIFQRYRTAAVRDFAARLEELPPERLGMIATFRIDQVTQILRPHIGDARSEKWRELPPPIPAELTRIFQPYLEPLGYSEWGA